MEEEESPVTDREKLDLSHVKQLISQLGPKPIVSQRGFFSQQQLPVDMQRPIPQQPVSDQSIVQVSNEALNKSTHRIPSGIPGFDELVGGGFIPNSIVLVSGEAGTGKTLFCTQFIWNALCMGENGVYITLQQSAEDIRRDVAQFGRDFSRAEKLGQCRIIFVEPQNMKDIVNAIIRNVKAVKAKRLAIDSITMICEYAEKRRDIRYNLSKLFEEIKKMGVTTLAISEVEEGSNSISRFGVEEFLVDGVVVLKCGVDVGLGGKPRSLYVKKLRRTSHDMNIHPFDISERGIKVIS